MSDNKSYNALTDDDDIHEANIVPGMQLRNSVVTKVRVEVTEANDRWKCKKFIHFLNGTQIISTYIKTSWDQLSELEKLGEISLSPVELEALKKAQPVKDDSEARRKARESIAQRKSTVKSPKPKPDPPPPQPKTFTIEVNKPDGTTVTIPGVKPNDTVFDIKKKLEDQDNIPVDEQSLLHKGQPLDDKPDSTMNDNGIKDGSILDLSEAPFTIQVKKPDGSTIKIAGVKPSDTVIDIKNKIKDQERIPVDSQWLLHKNKKLDQPKSTMKENYISDGSILHLVEPTFTVQVRKPDGETIEIPGIAGDDTVMDIKKKIEDQEGIPVKEQWIFFNGKELDDPRSTMKDNGISDDSLLDMKERPFEVQIKTPDGKKITIPNVLSGDTVLDIKKKIEDHDGMPVKEQWIFFNDKELKDPWSTMMDNGIRDGSLLDMKERPFQVHVKTPDGKKITIPNVLSGDTVLDIKKKIQDQEGIPVKEQWIFFNDKELDDPVSTMKDNGICDSSSLDLKERPFQLQVKKPDDKKITIPNVLSGDTVLDIKKKIQDQEGIPVKEQWIFFNGKELDDPESSMEDNGISDGSILDLKEPTFTINVKKPNGREIIIPGVKAKDTVLDIKKKINDLEGIPITGQLLVYNDNPLDDSTATMDDLGVRDRSTLQLEPMKIVVRAPDGRDIPLIVEPSTTIHAVKEMVVDSEAGRLPSVDHVRLSFRGKELDEPATTLEDYKVLNGSVLDLAEMQVRVRKPNGKVFSITAMPLDSIKALKQKIRSLKKTSVDEFKLLFDEKVLDDTPTLHDYDIRHGSTVDLDDTIRIKVRHQDGKVVKLLPLNVKPKDTIEDIKKQLEGLTGIPITDQLLEKDGDPLDNDKNVSESGIKDDCILYLSCLRNQMQIHIKKQWDGKQFTFDVEKDDSIVSIMEQIAKQESVPKNQQHLDYAGLSLIEAFEGGRKTLFDFGIKHDSVLNLEMMKIFVRTPTGKFTLSDGVARDTALMYIKDMIEKKSKIEPKDQILSFGSVKLDDGGKTLADYEILHKSTITLEQSDSNVPEFEVNLSPWQSSFGFVGKDGVKREGKRKKKPLGKEY